MAAAADLQTNFDPAPFAISDGIDVTEGAIMHVLLDACSDGLPRCQSMLKTRPSEQCSYHARYDNDNYCRIHAKIAEERKSLLGTIRIMSSKLSLIRRKAEIRHELPPTEKINTNQPSATADLQTNFDPAPISDGIDVTEGAIMHVLVAVCSDGLPRCQSMLKARPSEQCSYHARYDNDNYCRIHAKIAEERKSLLGTIRSILSKPSPNQRKAEIRHEPPPTYKINTKQPSATADQPPSVKISFGRCNGEFADGRPCTHPGNYPGPGGVMYCKRHKGMPYCDFPVHDKKKGKMRHCKRAAWALDTDPPIKFCKPHALQMAKNNPELATQLNSLEKQRSPMLLKGNYHDEFLKKHPNLSENIYLIVKDLSEAAVERILKGPSNTEMFGTTKGWIYIYTALEDDETKETLNFVADRPCKIGKTKDNPEGWTDTKQQKFRTLDRTISPIRIFPPIQVPTRVQKCANANGEEYVVLALIQTSYRHSLETTIHKHFEDKKMKPLKKDGGSEWFSVSPEEGKKVAEAANLVIETAYKSK